MQPIKRSPRQLIDVNDIEVYVNHQISNNREVIPPLHISATHQNQINFLNVREVPGGFSCSWSPAIVVGHTTACHFLSLVLSNDSHWCGLYIMVVCWYCTNCMEPMVKLSSFPQSLAYCSSLLALLYSVCPHIGCRTNESSKPMLQRASSKQGIFNSNVVHISR